MNRLVLIAAALSVLVSPAGAACLKADEPNQRAEGKLTVGRAKDAAGRTERPYILRLTANACLDTPDPQDKVRRTNTIHVYPENDALQASFKRLVGKNVRVRGNPMHAHTSHHHAPIVMAVTEISAR